MSIDIIYLEGNINDRVEVVTKSNKFDEDSDKWPIEQEWHNKLIRGEHYSTYLGNDIEKSEKQLNSIVTGELGTGIILNEFSMPEQEIYRRKALYNRHAFEAYVSEMISVERSLPDRRSQWCLDQYPVLPHLPRTSVIICFHNEALSTLLRTLYSVINRSSSTLLTEILLFDDASTLNHLKERLDRIIQEREELRNKVRLIRLTDRHGLIKCRLEGVKKAKSRVLTFLDSHVEASPGWLTPLLHRIYENKGVSVKKFHSIFQNGSTRPTDSEVGSDNFLHMRLSVRPLHLKTEENENNVCCWWDSGIIDDPCLVDPPGLGRIDGHYFHAWPSPKKNKNTPQLI